MNGWLAAITAVSLVVAAVSLHHARASADTGPDADRQPTSTFDGDAAVGSVDDAPSSTLSEARLAAALDALAVGVIVSGPDGKQIFANRVGADVASSHDRLSLVAATVADLTRSATQGTTGRREIDIFGPPPESYSVSAHPLDGRGGGDVVTLIEDVSERRRVDQVRRDFVANISHELKTPVGAVGLLADTLAGESDPAVVERLSARLAEEVTRLSATIDDLLQLAGIEFGEDAELDDVSVPSIVEEAVGRLRTAAEARSIRVVVDIATDSHTVVRGDRRQLVSALSNMVDNAIKYSGDSSEVTVRAADAEGSTVRIVVEDHGIGIPARDLDRIFERFYRVDRARGRQTGGTGLGLAIVRHVAQNHGGVASASSREGRGSTFTLTLPAVRP